MLSKSSINTSNCTSMNSVSVIIPVYGVENYIEQCLQSIIHQTMDHSLIECIIINDCTQDRSMEVAQEVIANYTGEMSFRIINHQVNRGLSVSRNTGIKEAKNDYLMFIDSDDYLLDDGLTRLMMMAEQQENDIVMGNFYDETNDCLAFPYKEDLWSQDHSLLYIGIRKVTAWNTLIKRQLFIDHHLRFEEGIYFEDVIFCYTLYQHIKSFAYMAQPSYFYRKNEKGIMCAQRYLHNDKSATDYAKGLKSMLDQLASPFYVAKSLYIHHFFSISLDFYLKQRDYLSDPQSVKKSILQLSRRFALSHLRHGHLLLLMINIFISSPGYHIMRWKLYRRYAYRIELIVNRCSLKRYPLSCIPLL